MSLIHKPEEIVQGKYRFTGVLGKGAVAVTYSAIDIQTNSLVAVKVISLKRLDNWKQVELFAREAEVLKKLNHPAIPAYIDYFNIETETDKAFYLVQQLAPGKSLSQLVESGWRTNEKEVKHIAQQVLEILSYLHSFDPPVIHRDIKPNNIIRSDDGKIYLVDFGAVQNTYYNTLMQGSTVVGTYGYMSPEQFQGRALPATDLYSLGATLLYLLTHRSPAELPQDTLKLDFRNHVDISESFANWLDKILEPDLDDRFSNADVALAELFKSKKKKQRKLITSISAIILILGLVTGFNSYKWFFLSRLGYYPADICLFDLNIKAVNDYLDKGGKTNFNKGVGFWKDKELINCVIKAITSNNEDRLNAIKTLINKQSNIDAIDKNGNTPLFNAVINNNTKIVKYLLDNGADTNIKNFSDKAPLNHAVNIHGNKSIVQMLLEHGAKVSDDNRKDLGYLYLLAAKESFGITKLLIKYGADINYQSSNKRTPLYNAIARGHLKTAKLLINSGAKVNIQDNYNQTPIFIAACNLNEDVVQMLIDAGANVNHTDTSGQNPLFCAAERASYNHRNYNIEVFKKLIDAGVNVNAKDYINQTPIFNAVHYSHKDVIQLLIDKGADVNAVSNDGSTPIFHCLTDKSAKLLIKNGANVNAKNLAGETPLFKAWHQDLVQTLIENGADVNVKDRQGRTLLSDVVVDMAKSNRHIDNFTLLINNGANFDEINYEIIKKIYDLSAYESEKVKFFLESRKIKEAQQ